MAQTVGEAFQVMISWLTPTTTESAAARGHRESIRQCIEAKFGLVAFFRTGSFGNATSVSGYSDVDYFAVLPRQRLSNHSRVSVARLRAALDERFPASGVAVDWPAVRVPFGENGAETTEVVVADYLGDTADGLRVFDIPSPSGGWMRSSPEAHHLYIRQLDEGLGGNLRPLIRLAKAWKCYCNAGISSFYVELQVAAHAAGGKTIVFEIDLPQVLRHLHGQSLATMNDPLGISSDGVSACSLESERAAALTKLATAVQLADAASAAGRRGQTALAFALWNRFFCGQFPGHY